MLNELRGPVREFQGRGTIVTRNLVIIDPHQTIKENIACIESNLPDSVRSDEERTEPNISVKTTSCFKPCLKDYMRCERSSIFLPDHSQTDFEIDSAVKSNNFGTLYERMARLNASKRPQMQQNSFLIDGSSKSKSITIRNRATSIYGHRKQGSCFQAFDGSQTLSTQYSHRRIESGDRVTKQSHNINSSNFHTSVNSIAGTTVNHQRQTSGRSIDPYYQQRIIGIYESFLGHLSPKKKRQLQQELSREASYSLNSPYY
ncbi:hypothetical protein FGO68_gene13111 [Halteria grandinella]|uniref:Uncharacterized protein n=1 Tax=Halteria grandinella TaxID=5974 RepID=A0A8J8NRL3_HALGN|nr:hypothetical protein FGO68_gene13111 [Halteria grandinella]